jgi:hypothetical protein
MSIIRAWHDHDLVFPNEIGDSLFHSVVERAFYKTAAAGAVPRIAFHDLRHTAATLLLLSGVPVAEVSEMLGHADPSITYRVYAQRALRNPRNGRLPGVLRAFRGAQSPRRAIKSGDCGADIGVRTALQPRKAGLRNALCSHTPAGTTSSSRCYGEHPWRAHPSSDNSRLDSS